MAVPEGVPSPARQKAVIKELSKESMKLGEKWHLICAKYAITCDKIGYQMCTYIPGMATFL